MNLEDFVNQVEEPNRIHTLYNGGGRRPDELNIIDVLVDALCNSNLLATDVVYQQGGYASSLNRAGVVMSKQERDYEADDEHYVYRAVYSLSPGSTIRTTSETRVPTRADAIRRLLELSESLPFNEDILLRLNGAVEIEVTQYGRMYEHEACIMTLPRTWNVDSYSFGFQTLSDNLVANAQSVRRCSLSANGPVRYSLIDSKEGLVGEIQLKVKHNSTESMTPLTEEDMTLARGFIKLENEYDGWIPDEIRTNKPVISADAFSLYRTADTDRSIKATTVLEKTKDRRTYFNCETQLTNIDKRYTVPPGEYFFAPTSDINLMSMFDYDVWLTLVSATISMTKNNSRVGFLRAAADYQDAKAVNITEKTIAGSADKDVGSTFTRRANFGRLK